MRPFLRFLLFCLVVLCTVHGAYSQVIDLTGPDGGEVFSQGDVVAVTWTGVPKTQQVKLEYTTDGSTWQQITDSATGGRYLWALPSIIGNCRVRASISSGGITLLRTLATQGDQADGAVFSPDETVVAGVSLAGKVYIWSVQTGELITSFVAHSSGIIRCDFSEDGTKFATCSADGTVKVWNTGSWTLKRTLKPTGSTSTAFGVRFSPDGNEVVAGYADGRVRVWNVETGSARLDFLAHPNGQVRCVDYSRDGGRLFTASLDATAGVWSAVDGSKISILDDHSELVNSVRVSNDGSLIATGSFDNTAKLWDGNTYRLIRTLTGHSGDIYAVKFDPAGQRLLTTSDDQTAIVWRVSDGGVLATLHHGGTVARGIFSPSGNLIATASTEGDVKIWGSQQDVSVGTFQVAACGEVGAVRGENPKPMGKAARPDLR